MSPFLVDGRDRTDTGGGEPESAAPESAAAKRIPDDLASMLAEAMLRTIQVEADTIPAAAPEQAEAAVPAIPNEAHAVLPAAPERVEAAVPAAPERVEAVYGGEPGPSGDGGGWRRLPPQLASRLPTGMVLTALALLLGTGIAAAGLGRDGGRGDGGRVRSPQLRVASNINGVVQVKPGDAVTFAVSGAAAPTPVSSKAAALEVTKGIPAPTTIDDEAVEEQRGTQIVSGEITFVDGRLVATLELAGLSGPSGPANAPVRLRLSLVEDGRLLVSHETDLPSRPSATGRVIFRDGSEVLVLPGSMMVAGDRVTVDWDLETQASPPGWSGAGRRTVELVLTVDTSPGLESDAAFVRYQQDLGPISLDTSMYPADPALAFQTAAAYRATAYAAVEPDTETVECILASVKIEQEERARFEPDGVAPLAIPCLLATRFATSPAGAAANDGLAGFVADPTGVVRCIASRLGAELTTIEEYAAISSGDYTAWSPSATDTYAGVLEACVELRPLYLAQFNQYAFQRSTCPAEMTDYVLAAYSWKVFITEGILDADANRRAENQAAFGRYIDSGYETLDCFVGSNR